MNICDAERAFREQLPCETVAPDINTMKIRRLGAPVGILVKRHESQMTVMFLIFSTGENSETQYQIELIKLADSS